MRKKVIGAAAEAGSTQEGNWLDLETIAEVEVSSEASGFPVEAALVSGSEKGWQAAALGEARIQLRFDTPIHIAQVLLHCTDSEHERSQEWSLRAQLADGTERELLRQGWNFSPGGSTEQREVYTVNLNGVRTLTLTIDPDRGRNRYPATLAAWRVSAAQ